jgi:HD-GYP domain-containing protein (c-di-GMP phosphodiesterase class II)
LFLPGFTRYFYYCTTHLIIDVWDALTTDRPYRAAWKESEAKNYLLEQSGVMFDPEIVPVFLDLLNQDK